MNRLLKGLVLFLVALSLVFSFCACTQKGEAASAVEKVTLNKKTLELDGGQSFQLVATVYPETASQEIKWTVSAGKDYAKVSADGKVTVDNTGNSSASATITATSVADSTKKASCKITVNVTPPIISDLSADPADPEEQQHARCQGHRFPSGDPLAVRHSAPDDDQLFAAQGR